MTGIEPIVIGGRYQVGELLGRGGMAEVRKGTDTRLGRVVAIKRLRTDLASDSTFQARFRREAQASASLNHPAIVAVYDTGEEPTPDGVDQPYIVMEYVAGRTLRDVLREGRKILPERALEIASDVLSALDYSHRAGIIHRDIKPGNVMLTPSGDVKVMDFGIARAMSDQASTMTQTAAVVGTAQYLSPEQAKGETVDSRSDVYSAACMLYELLTGRPPFVGDSPVSVAYQHVREEAPPPSSHDPGLPPEVDAIVMKGLAKRLEDRYQSAAAMRSDIERFLAGRPIQAVAPAPGPAEEAPTSVVPVAAAPVAGPTEDDEPEERGPRPWLIAVLVGIVLVLVAVGGFFLPRLFDETAERVPIPELVGQTKVQAAQQLGEARLEPRFVEQSDPEVAVDVVIEQDPPGGQGAYADPGDVITLVVSTGPPDVEMPDVVGSTLASARAQLEGDPYEFTVKVRRADSDAPAGQVLATDPEARTMMTGGSGAEVLLTVSKGPKKVPDVVGDRRRAAVQQIRDRGFVPVIETEEDTTEPAGTVVRQTPRGDTSLPQGEEVVIWVSTYVEPLPPCPTTTTQPNPSDPSQTETVPVEPDPGDPATCEVPEEPTTEPTPTDGSTPGVSPGADGTAGILPDL